MTPFYILLAIFFISNTIHGEPYVIFLNPSNFTAVNVSHYHQQVYSIGEFHWYMDDLNDSDVRSLLRLNHIMAIHKDETLFHTSGHIQTDLPSWGLDRIDQREGGDDQFHFPSSAGEGVNIYLIDTGVNIEHDDFEGRAKHGKTFTSDKIPEDTNGHGSFVAGVCCGKLYGVAKKANIISVKALDHGGSGKLGNILQALHWVVKRHLKKPGSKSIVNLSLAAEYHLPTNQAIEQAIQLGIHFSIAAGNQGGEACRYSPASTKNALVVGALNPDDSIASYSNVGSCVDIYAPGTAITSVWHRHKKDIHVLSGTSMAAPHVAGVMATLLSENDYSPYELIQKVKETATIASVHLETTKKDDDIAYEISQLTGTSYDNLTKIKVLYMEPSSFAQNSNSGLRVSCVLGFTIRATAITFIFFIVHS